jgi:hypothetical protein
MSENDDQFQGLMQAIAASLDSLIFNDGFELPIGCVSHAANGSWMLGCWDAAPDGQGLAYRESESRCHGEGLKLPVTVTFLDGASGRASSLRLASGLDDRRDDLTGAPER